MRRQAWIFDMDGTLAIGAGVTRNAYDESCVMTDVPNPAVVQVLQALAPNYTIIVMSGRHNTCRKDTEAWMQEHLGFVPWMLMREARDNRKDFVIKEELYRAFVEPDYEVLGVFDDRQQVVDLWRRLGLTCFQVAKSPD
jgi:hypothetical protein